MELDDDKRVSTMITDEGTRRRRSLDYDKGVTKTKEDGDDDAFEDVARRRNSTT